MIIAQCQKFHANEGVLVGSKQRLPMTHLRRLLTWLRLYLRTKMGWIFFWKTILSFHEKFIKIHGEIILKGNAVQNSSYTVALNFLILISIIDISMKYIRFDCKQWAGLNLILDSIWHLNSHFKLQKMRVLPFTWRKMQVLTVLTYSVPRFFVIVLLLQNWFQPFVQWSGAHPRNNYQLKGKRDHLHDDCH